MTDRDSTDETFFAKYRAYQDQEAVEFLRRLSASEGELRETIDYLIHNRQLLRDVELDQLGAELETHLERMKETKLKILLEEITCLKDILALHKQRVRENEQPRD